MTLGRCPLAGRGAFSQHLLITSTFLLRTLGMIVPPYFDATLYELHEEKCQTIYVSIISRHDVSFAHVLAFFIIFPYIYINICNAQTTQPRTDGTGAATSLYLSLLHSPLAAPSLSPALSLLTEPSSAHSHPHPSSLAPFIHPSIPLSFSPSPFISLSLSLPLSLSLSLFLNPQYRGTWRRSKPCRKSTCITQLT